ncbi:unnamed protein product, partial [Trichobilharzia regenti]
LTPSDTDIQQSYNRQITLAKSYRPQPPPSLTYSATSAINTSLNTAINNDLIRVDDNQLGSGNGGGGNPGLVNNWTGSAATNNLNSRAPDELMSVDDNMDGNMTNPREVGDNVDTSGDQDCLYENNQKLELCSALIRLGDWTNAQRLLDRLPGYWASSYKPLTKDICSLLHCLIEPLYDKVCPLPACLQRNRSRSTTESFKAVNTSTTPNKIDEKSADCEMDEELSPETNNTSSNNKLLSQVHDFIGLAKYVIPIAVYLGPHMSYDLVLMVKFCRLGHIYLSEQHNSQSEKIGIVYQGFFNLLDEVLLPSLSLVDANCCLAEEIWQMLRFMPYEHRKEQTCTSKLLDLYDDHFFLNPPSAEYGDNEVGYPKYRLYGQWKHFSAQTEPSLIRRRAQVLCYAKAIMKRLSKENVKPMGRHLGKLSHSNPGLLFDHVSCCCHRCRWLQFFTFPFFSIRRQVTFML